MSTREDYIREKEWEKTVKKNKNIHSLPDSLYTPEQEIEKMRPPFSELQSEFVEAVADPKHPVHPYALLLASIFDKDSRPIMANSLPTKAAED